MKKLLFISILVLFFNTNAFSNIKLDKFKSDLKDFKLEEKAYFCFPAFEVAQYNYIYYLKNIFELKDISDEKKEKERNKYLKAFKAVFYYQTLIAFYWIEGDENYSFTNKTSRDLINKKIKENLISIKGENYLSGISFEEFNDSKILTTCIKSLENFFNENKKILKIKEFLKKNEQSVEDEGIIRMQEILEELEKKL